MCIDPQLRILINSYCALIVLVLNFDNMTKDCISMVWIFPRELPVRRGMPRKHTAALLHLLCFRIPAM